MIQPKADLHIHTTVSDGVKSPEEIVKFAYQKGLKAISITDHDSYAGYIKAKVEADKLDIFLIPGIEITSEFKGREVHILGYGFDPEHSDILAFVQDQKLRRYKRANKMIQNLNSAGFDISLDEVTAESRTMNISRNHIASVLVRKGLVSNVRTVFDRWLGNDALAYHKTEYEKPSDVIELLRSAGGVSVLAHPGLYYLQEDIEQFIEDGIDGFECIHPSHNFELQKKYQTVCKENGLLETGGSDYHGYKKEEENYFGVVAINLGYVDRLIERCSYLSNIYS